ncbi:MAG: hypothetical protein M1826_000552 [Phylliscum demangeonii]|nr:MAG: hypothetical protein M1826_000552 [Phylliscum demangeonii]
MPPRLHLFRPARALALRPRPRPRSLPRPMPLPLPALALAPRASPFAAPSSRASSSSSSRPISDAPTPATGPNQDVLPHVSEEAAAIGAITGEGGPEVEEVGTPVQEILSRDEEAKEMAPKVIQEELNASNDSAASSSLPSRPSSDPPATGPNQDVLPHVSEEAAAIGAITGEGGPEVEEQGTPVQEILRRGEDAKEKAPRVIQEELNALNDSAASSSFPSRSSSDPPAKGPNQDVLPHASEEAAAIGAITGEGGPKVEEQGTPVQEILRRDEDAKEKAPRVIQEELNASHAADADDTALSSTTTSPSSRLSSNPPATGPNQDVLPHVSEEATAIDAIAGEGGPEVEEQGTPAQEILRRDEDAKQEAPKVIQEELNATDTVAAAADAAADTADRAIRASAAQAQLEAVYAQTQLAKERGHKFGLPALPLASNGHMRYRYDPIVDQITNLMMVHGKKSVAQRNMAFILSYLRASQPPQLNAMRPLIPGAPLPEQLPLQPILYLTLAIDSVAPLLRIRFQHGAAGGGVALAIPLPLGLRQRRRRAFLWILEAADKRASRGSGKYMFAQRIADELIAVVEGRSTIWERRTALHKLAVSSRINVHRGRGRR